MFCKFECCVNLNAFSLFFTAKPGKPNKPEIMGTDKSSVALKWAPPTDDGGAPITNYVIEYKPTDAFRWIKANENQTVTEPTFSVTGLKEGSQCEFRVAAQNKAGVGEASEPTKPVKVEAPLGKIFFKYCSS